MEVHVNNGQASATVKVLAERVRQIDDTECNDPGMKEELRIERMHLVAVIGEITLAGLI